MACFMEDLIFGQVYDALQPHYTHLGKKAFCWDDPSKGTRPPREACMILTQGGSSQADQSFLVLGGFSGWPEYMKIYSPENFTPS